MIWSLRTLILVVLTVVSLLLGGTAYLIHSSILLPSFLDLEQHQIDADVERVFQALDNEKEHLSLLVNDWSSWDDSYRFVVDLDPAYVQSNLSDATFVNNRVNLLLFIDNDGHKLLERTYDAAFVRRAPASPFDQELYLPSFPLLRYRNQSGPLNGKSMAGMMLTDAGPMLCVARPILDSDDHGPSRGTLIMGRLVDEAMRDKIARMTRIDFSLRLLEGAGREQMLPAGVHRYVEGDEVLRAIAIYPDVDGKPLFELTVKAPRSIILHGQEALGVALTLMIAGIVTLMLLVTWVMRRSVELPLRHLSLNILSRRQSRENWKNLEMGPLACREVALIADEFNQLMESLHTKRSKLAEMNVNLLNETRKLKQAQETLEKLDELKSEFISTAAHELRTPVTSVMGYAELLCQHDTAPELFSPEQHQEFLLEIYANCERLNRIVDDILDVSRIEAGQSLPLDIQPAPTEVLLRKAAERFRIAGSHPILFELKVGTPEFLEVDAHRVNQVLENLLSNAVKYSPKGRPIRLSAEKEGAGCRITVSDHGIGMNDEQKARIFEKFYRADTTDTAVRGLGLGMSIVKQIVEDHGGTITVESRPGEGTLVSFTLPGHREG